jgi:hypothetical protein
MRQLLSTIVVYNVCYSRFISSSVLFIFSFTFVDTQVVPCIFSSSFPLKLFTNVTKLFYPVLVIFTTVAFHFLVYIDVFSMHQVRNYSPLPSINNSIKVSSVIYDLFGNLLCLCCCLNLPLLTNWVFKILTDRVKTLAFNYPFVWI